MKAANKQHSKMNNEYELTFKDNGTMDLCEDSSDVPTMTHNFVRYRENLSDLFFLSICILFLVFPTCPPASRTPMWT